MIKSPAITTDSIVDATTNLNPQFFEYLYILCKTRKLSKIYWTLDTNWAVIGLSTKVGTRRSAEGTADRVCGGEGGGGGDGGGGDPVVKLQVCINHALGNCTEK